MTLRNLSFSDSSPLLATATDLDDQVIEQIPRALCICRASDGAIIRYNARAVHLWGQAPRPGQPLTGASRVRSFEDGRPLSSGESALEAVLDGGPAVSEDLTILERPDGSLVTVTADVSPLQDAAGDLVGAISAFENARRPITAATGTPGADEARRTSSSAPDDTGAAPAISPLIGVWDYDLGTRRALRSVTHDQIYGYPTLLPEWTFDTFVQHVVPDQRDRIVAAFDRCLGGAAADFDCCIVRADGTPAWIWSRGCVVRDVAGAPRRVVGVVMDVTRRMRAAQALERDVRRRDAFIATLAHELRQPLSALLAAVELIDRVPDRAAVTRAASVMRRQIGRMGRLVDDVVNSARWARGKITVLKRRIDLQDVIREAIADVQASASARGHDLTAPSESGPIWVDADAERLAQVFSNLLRNAVKYTDPGGRIWVTVERATDVVVTSVHDTGIGIASEEMTRIFELFAQVHADVADDDGGLGIGLSVVRNIVALHGGTIECRSEGLGYGSEFILTLPLAEDRRRVPNVESPDTDRRDRS